MKEKEIRVLIIEQLVSTRFLLTKKINAESEIVVVGAVADSEKAEIHIKRLKPDVVVLNESLSYFDSATSMQRLLRSAEISAVRVLRSIYISKEDWIEVTQKGENDEVEQTGLEITNTNLKGLINRIKLIHWQTESRMDRLRKTQCSQLLSGFPRPPERKPNSREHQTGQSSINNLIAIGASMGGIDAVKTILAEMPENAPAVVVTLHLPESICESYAQRIDRLCLIKVKQVEDGEYLLSGHAYIAPGNQHFLIERYGGRLISNLMDEQDGYRYQPSVDVMFQSLVEDTQLKTVAVLLTGMGADGAKGLLKLHQAGVYTIAQDKQSSLVWGMPKSAIDLGAVSTVLPLSSIATKALDYFEESVEYYI